MPNGVPATELPKTKKSGRKKAALASRFRKEAGRKGISSGKWMQDVEVEARALTLVFEKSKNLEEG